MKRFSLFLIFLCCLFVTGCGNSNKEKTVKTLNDFEIAATSNGFVVTNNMDSYENVSYIMDSMKATLGKVEIEMVIYDNEDNAKKAHDSHIEVFNGMKGSGATLNKNKGKNYYSYNMISNGYYMISERVGNTLVFSKTQLANKEKVDKLLRAMDY